MNYIIVRNPAFPLWPAFVSRLLGEEYLYVDVFPKFTDDIRQARVFPSYQWANSYLFNNVTGARREAYADCIVRRTFRADNIPGLSKGTEPVQPEKETKP